MACISSSVRSMSAGVIPYRLESAKPTVVFEVSIAAVA
jgi:hypothetical protein